MYTITMESKTRACLKTVHSTIPIIEKILKGQTITEA